MRSQLFHSGYTAQSYSAPFGRSRSREEPPSRPDSINPTLIDSAMLLSRFRLLPCGRFSKTRLDSCRMTHRLVKPRGATVCLAMWPQGDPKGNHQPSFYNPGQVDTQYKVGDSQTTHQGAAERHAAPHARPGQHGTAAHTEYR